MRPAKTHLWAKYFEMPPVYLDIRDITILEKKSEIWNAGLNT